MDLGAARADLVDVLGAIAGYEVKSAVNANHDPPCILVGVPQEIEYHVSLDGGTGPLTRVDMPVRIVVNGSDPDEAMTNLDAALSYGTDGSVASVLEAAQSDREWASGGLQVLGVTNIVSGVQGDAPIVQADVIARLYFV